MRCKRLLHCLIACSAVLCAVVGAPGAAQAQGVPVLVVHSYNAEYVWVDEISHGIREALRGTKAELTFRYLDAKRRPEPEDIRRAADQILEDIERLHPRIVIAVDDPAQAYVVAPHLKGRGDIQVIFCGVNAQLSLYGYPAANVSGVRERWHFREGFALLKKIAPELKRVALLLDDSESSGFVADDMREQRRKGGPFALDVSTVLRAKTFQEWQAAALAAQKRGDALALGLYHSLRDGDTDRVVPPDVVSAWNNHNLRRPTLGFTDFVKSHGQLCGVLESGREQGQLAGQMARLVLERGVSAGRLPVRMNQRGLVLVNLKTAARLGLTVPYEILQAAEVVER